VSDSLCLQGSHVDSVILQDRDQLADTRHMFNGSVLEPRERPVLLSMERGLSCREARGTLQVLVEPRTKHLMLVFLVRIEPSCVAEISNGVEHAERPLRISIDFGDNESQVHNGSAFWPTGNKGPSRRSAFYSRKEVVAAATVVAASAHTAFLESAVQNH